MRLSLAPLSDALARLPFADRFTGVRAVARREVWANLKSLRMIVIAALMGLAIIGGAWGLTAFSGIGNSEDTATVFYVHPASTPGNNSTSEIVVFVADAWGVPHADFAVTLSAYRDETGGPRPGPSVILEVATLRTNSDGFVRFSGLEPGLYALGYKTSTTTSNQLDTVGLGFPEPWSFSLSERSFDLGRNGSRADWVYHATDALGAPLAGADILVEGVPTAVLDAHGFGRLTLPPGEHNITVRSGNLTRDTFAFVNEPNPSGVELGPDVILYAVSTLFIPFFVPIAAIALAHDAIARERAQGSLDFILSRPATRYGVITGKFVGVVAALLVPVFATLLVGAAVISTMSGKPVSLGFLGGILFAVSLYVASYTLIVLILSTVAKSTGTAIMFGVLLWVLYNIMWGVVVALVGFAIGVGYEDQGYQRYLAYTSMFNLNSLYGGVVASAYPLGGANPFTSGGVEILPVWAPLAASLVWLVALFALALWVFDRKAAE